MAAPSAAAVAATDKQQTVSIHAAAETIATNATPSKNSDEKLDGSISGKTRQFQPLCSNLQLPTVLVQLVMEALDQHSTLALARCSKYLHHCASSPMAWHPMHFHILPVSSESSQKNITAIARVQSSLLRFQPLCALEGSDEDDGMRYSLMPQGGNSFSISEPTAPAWLRACAELPYLRAVHLSLQQQRKAVEIMACLEALPHVQSLCDLRISCYVSPRESATVANMLHQLASLPKLRALHFAGSWERWMDARTGAKSDCPSLDVSPLAVASSLSDLTLDISDMISQKTYLQLLEPVIERGMLRALSLESPFFTSGGELRAFLRHLGVRCAQLQRLVLLKPGTRLGHRRSPLAAAEWLGALDSLLQLRHITVSQVHPGVLVAALQPCTQLEEAHVQLASDLFVDAVGSVSAQAAADFLAAMPQARVMLQLPDRKRFHVDTTECMHTWCRSLEHLSSRVHVHDARLLHEQKF